jgi:hypothetical protein
MYSLRKNPYIVYTQDPQKQPPKKPGEVWSKTKEVDPIKEALLNGRLNGLKAKSEKTITHRKNALVARHDLHASLVPKEKISFSEKQLQDYSSATLNNIIKSGSREKAQKLIEAELLLTSGNVFLESGSREKKIAILQTLKLALGDTMFFQTLKSYSGEVWRNILGDNARTYESFRWSVETGLRNATKTGRVQSIKFDENEWYVVVDLQNLRAQILENVNGVNRAQFRALINSGDDWKNTLNDLLGKEAIGKIWVYLEQMNWKSKLITELSNYQKQQEVSNFFKIAVQKYTKKQTEAINSINTHFGIHEVFAEKNFQNNFPNLLKLGKWSLERYPSLKMNPPIVTEFWRELVKSGATSGEVLRYMTAFDLDIENLRKQAEQRRAEILNTKPSWSIPDFLGNIPGLNREIIQKFHWKKYPLRISTTQARELHAILSAFQGEIPPQYKKNFTLLLENLQNQSDIKKLNYLTGSAKQAKDTAAWIVKQKWNESKAEPLTKKQEKLVEAAGSVNAAFQENTFLIKEATVDALKLWYNLDELKDDPEKVGQIIRDLEKKSQRSEEEQNLLDTLRWIQQNSQQLRASIAIIVTNTDARSLKEAQQIITRATGGGFQPTERQIQREVSNHHFEERQFLSNTEKKLIEMSSWESLKASEVYISPFQSTNSIANYTIISSGEFERTIVSDTGKTLYQDVPVWTVPSVMSELDVFHNSWLQVLEPHIPLLNSLISKRLANRGVDSFDGDFGHLERIRLLSVITEILYGKENIPSPLNIGTFERFYTNKQQLDKEQRPERRLKDLGIINQDGTLMEQRLKEVLS